jgi:hypothetical protein
MTNEILETDIELARNLLGNSLPEAEVISALVVRGIQPARAAKLVLDLLQGKNPEPDRPFQAAFSEPAEAPAPTPITPQRREKSQSFSRTEKVGTKNRYFFPGVIVALIVLCGGVVYLNRRSHPAVGPQPAKANEAGSFPASQKTDRALSIEVLDDGVYLAGNKITSRAALGAFIELLGPAPRTNRLDAVNRFVYAYDSQGILLYSSDGVDTESILFDFTAIGGATGAKAPFSGELKVAGREIKTDTGASVLGQIKGLGVDKTDPGTGVVAATYNGVRLLFSYFSNPDRLSLLEIDYK